LNWSHQFNGDWAIKQQFFRHDVKSKYDPFYFVWDFAQVSPGSWTVDRARSFGDGRDRTTATILDLTGHFDTAGLKHTFLLGGDYYKKETTLHYGYSDFINFSTTDAFNPAPPALALDPTGFSNYESSTENYGVYVQDQIKLPGNIHLLAGLRYQKVTNTSSNTDATGLATPGDPQSDSATTPRVGLLWQARDWLSLYGNYAENFGANTGRDWLGQPLKPESAQQKEIGVKAEFLGGKLRTSLAYFDLTKQNVATADKVNDPSGIFGYQVAVGEVRSKGTELDIQGEIRPGWNVITTYAHTDIRITKSNNGDVGLRKENVPKDMASLWTTYEFKHETLRGWRIGGGATYRSSATDSSNTIVTPSFTLVDAMTAYEFKMGKNKVTAQLNINNLFNESYYTDAWVSGNVGVMQFGTPRSATASLRVEF
jgi:iron complex outermembrane receptor protein